MDSRRSNYVLSLRHALEAFWNRFVLPPRPNFQALLTRRFDVACCEGFRMTAHRDDSACTGAVVRKPPVKERAGDEVPTVRQALW
jgi:hypothetical protein